MTIRNLFTGNAILEAIRADAAAVELEATS
jgi:hypothetical protein